MPNNPAKTNFITRFGCVVKQILKFIFLLGALRRLLRRRKQNDKRTVCSFFHVLSSKRLIVNKCCGEWLKLRDNN